MYCHHYQSGRCQSCQWLNREYSQQLLEKQHQLEQLLQENVVNRAVDIYLPPVSGQESAFRNKAKMVVSGSVEKPILGIQAATGEALDLCDCPLYQAELQLAFPTLKQFIAKAGLTPYNVQRKRGELKYLLLTQNELGQLMLRLVLRSELKVSQIQSALPWLLSALPQLQVVSANIQPVHMAILEGDKEIILTAQSTLKQQINHVPLFIRPGSFFQTNSVVAARLYQTAQDWVKPLNVNQIWDLFCGVGGFGLHCADKNSYLTGIEINQQAVECAKQSAALLNLTHIHFQALDLTQFEEKRENTPELVIVNPPRRGLGKALCQYLNQLQPNFILYSSCNAATMAKDIASLAGYQLQQVQLFDMFPHTAHYEVLTLLVRQD